MTSHDNNSNPQRSRFTSSWGAVFAAAGVAIGLGNIWRFPYMMGRDGGSAFLIFYLFIMAAFGAPMLMCEWALGRHTRRGPWGAYQRAGAPMAKLISTVLMITIVMASAYYAVVIGWVAQEAWTFAGAALNNTTPPEFASLTSSFQAQFPFLIFVVLVGCGVLLFGVKRGIERLSAILLPLFFLLFTLILIRVLTLDGAVDELLGFLKPKWGDFRAHTALSALGQAIFSLGLGGTFMVLYGSYMTSDLSIPKAAIFTVATDLAAALLAGLIVVPAVLVMGRELDAGPALLFNVIPDVFAAMPMGTMVGFAFFLSVFVVAMLSLIAAYEALTAAMNDALGWSRRRALTIVAISQIALAVPAYFIPRYIEINDLIWGTTMQPIGAVLAVLTLTWWLGRTAALEELRKNSSLPIPIWLFWWVRLAIPIAILAILVFGWWDWARPS